jgi:hypothetical protein
MGDEDDPYARIKCNMHGRLRIPISYLLCPNQMQYAWAIENTNLIYLLCPNQMQCAWAIENTNMSIMPESGRLRIPISYIYYARIKCNAHGRLRIPISYIYYARIWAIENTNLIYLLCPNQMQHAWAIENTNLIYLLCPNKMQHAWAIENTNIGYLTYSIYTAKMQIHIKNGLYSNPRYANYHARPDISFCVAVLSKYSASPLQMHFTAAKRTLRYLKKTANYVLHFPSSNGLKTARIH